MTGSYELRCTPLAGRTRAVVARSAGLARTSRGLPEPDGALRVVVATLGPGILAGDTFAGETTLEAGACAIVAGQMATPVYAGAAASAQTARWRIGSGAALFVLAEPLMLDPGAEHRVNAEVELAAGGFALLAETVVLAAGSRLRSTTSARIDGRLVARDALALRGTSDQPEAVGSVLLLGAGAALVARVEALALGWRSVRAGIGGTGEALVVRLLGRRAWEVQRALDVLLALGREAVSSVPAA